MGKKIGTPEFRFWRRIIKSDGCWIWNGTKNLRGYGNFSLKRGVTVGAHRFSYQLNIGPIPENMSVCHRCDNPSCVRPDHLFLGSPKDNSRDMVAKGRGTRGTERKGTGPAGERNSHARLTHSIVSEIRERRHRDGLTHRQLSKIYNISKSQIGNILSGAQWSSEGSLEN